MADGGRARRLAGRIRQIVAVHLETQVKDPRLGMVTVTEVRVSGDLHDATIFYTVLGTDDERADSAVALESASGLIRSEVGRQTGVRFTPTIAFVLDSLSDQARHIHDVLAVAARADAELAAVRQGAAHAGEQDPYRKPRTIDDDFDDEADDDFDDDFDDEADDDFDDVDDVDGIEGDGDVEGDVEADDEPGDQPGAR